MKRSRWRKSRATARVVGAGLACLGLASCSDDYLARRDTLSAGSGDAVRADIAKQVIDPWPPNSRLESLDANGQRIQHAMELYRNPSSGIPASPTSSGVGVPIAK